MSAMNGKGQVNPALDLSDEHYDENAFKKSFETKVQMPADSANKSPQSEPFFEDLVFEPNFVAEKIEQLSNAVSDLLEDNRALLSRALKVLLAVGFNVFFFYAIYYASNVSTEGIQWCEGFGFFLILTLFVYWCLFYYFAVKPLAQAFMQSDSGKQFRVKVMEPAGDALEAFFAKQWSSPLMYGLVTAVVFVYLLIDTVNNRSRLYSFFGLIVLVLLGWVFSKHPSKVVWRHVFWGLGLQFIFGVLIIRTETGEQIFSCMGDKATTLLDYTDQGSSFVFGYLVTQEPFNPAKLSNDSAAFEVVNSIYSNRAVNFIFFFKVLSVIYFLSFAVSMLFYLGAMQWVVIKLGWLLQVTVGTTACESLNASANIFLGQTEAPLMIKPFLPIMTNSEIHAVMTGGFATIAGAVLAAYISFGVSASHLLSASVMSAPAALACGKLLYPETKKSKTTSGNIVIPKGQEANLLDAAGQGAAAAVVIVANIAATLIAVLAFIGFINGVLNWCGLLVGVEGLSFEFLLGKCFIPLSWLMGIPVEDLESVGTLIGLKTFVNEFAAYDQMRRMTLQPRSKIIATYALCGFSNPASIGMQIACLSSMAPGRRSDISKVAFRAFVAGSLACFLTACVAGSLID